MKHNPTNVKGITQTRLEHIVGVDGNRYHCFQECIEPDGGDPTDVVEEKEYLSFTDRTIWIYPNPENVRKVYAAAHQESKPGHVARLFARLKFWHTKAENECAVPSFLRKQAD